MYERAKRKGKVSPGKNQNAHSKARAEASRWIGLKFWRVAQPYWASEERWSALAILGTIIAFVVVKVYSIVMLNDAGGRFFNALQSRNQAGFYHTMILIALFLLLQLVSIVFQSFFSQLLEIRWRRWLTAHFINGWLVNQAFYQMRFSGRADNPDQRISDDIRLLISDTLSLAVGLLSTTLTVTAFASVLWNLSGPLTLSFKGISITPSGYMFWAALIYWLLGSLLGYALGNPLIRLNNRQQGLEADFRFALIRVREKAEGIALYGGQPQERSRTREIFYSVYTNSINIALMNTKLLAFQTFIGDGPQILPFLATAPRFFSGSLAFGDLMKVGNGFGQISMALSWLVNSYSIFADWHATVDRLAEFKSDLDQINSRKTKFEASYSGNGSIVLNEVNISLPDGHNIISHLTLQLKRGQTVLIRGRSGSGKSTLFRVLAGLWPFGAGHIQLPENIKSLFLPQQPYIPIGTLRRALWFPSLTDLERDEEVRAALAAVGLNHLSSHLNEEMHWEQLLSLGEQQRLAISQAILFKPDWLFLDEATSALDEEQEASVYQTLANLLPRTTIISIGHRQTLEPYHSRVILLTQEPRRSSVTG